MALMQISGEGRHAAWPPWVRHLLRDDVARILAAVVFVVAVTALVAPLALPFEGRLMKAVETAAHFPLFFALVWAATTFWPRRMPHHFFRHELPAVVALAVLFEGIQFVSQRDPSWIDAAVSSLGGVAALLVRASLRVQSSVIALAARGVAAGLALAACAPAILVVADRAQARMAYPLLASFEGRSEIGRWWGNRCRMGRTTQQATHGRHALRIRVDAKPSLYPGAFQTDGPKRWDGAKQLCMDVFLTGTSSRGLWLRFDDRRGHPPYEDRAQTLVNLTPGPNVICLDLDSAMRTPGGRELDRRHIVSWGFFLDSATGGEVLFLDHVRLIP